MPPDERADRRRPLPPEARRHGKLVEQLAEIAAGGDMTGRRIVIADPDEPVWRQVYEDVGADEDGTGGRALVTLEPGATRALLEGGDGTESRLELPHAAALADAMMMVGLGWVVVEVARERRLVPESP